MTFAEARQHLDRFCAKLPDKDISGQTAPIFLLEGEPGIEMRARVYLPSSLSPNLRTATSRLSWKTEKRAKQDAAFQAYRALHKAGLISDHLLPPEWPRENKAAKEDDKIEGRDSLYEVENQYDPWPKVMELWNASSGATIYAHRIRVEGPECVYPVMLILLPLKLSSLEFPLFQSCSAGLHVTVETGAEMPDFTRDIAQSITHLLLTTMLGRRLPGLRKELLPFLIVPEVKQSALKAWYEAASTSIPMTDFNESPPTNGKTWLVRHKSEKVPYLWQSSHEHYEDPEARGVDAGTPTYSINAARLPRKLNYLHPSEAAVREQSEVLPVDECSVLGIPGEYARLILLMPSITFEIEMLLRSADACEGPLEELR